MKRAASYILSNYSYIFNHSLEDILNVGYQSKGGCPIPSFDENLLLDLCSDVQHIFEKENNILNIDGDFVIVGDIHGSFHDLLRILKFIQENPSKVLFLGDYVDRGEFSLECITILFAIKVMNPDKCFLLRGNHEFDSLCHQYGFRNEIINHKKGILISNNSKDQQYIDLSNSNSDNDDLNNSYTPNNDLDHYKYTEKLYRSFMKTFSYLPICAIINNTTFCIHGGLSPKLDHIDYINKIHRPISEFEDDSLLSDVVWSDPSQHSGCFFQENPRGLGNLFNRDAVSNFLKINSLSRIIRAHQCVQNGALNNFGDKCITVFSASSYNKSMNNFSAVLQLFQHDDQTKISIFPPILRLRKEDAFYYKVQSLNPNEDRIPICFSLSHPILHMNMPQRMISTKSLVRLYGSRNEIPMEKQKSLLTIPSLKSKNLKNPRRISQIGPKPVLNNLDPLKIIKKRVEPL